MKALLISFVVALSACQAPQLAVSQAPESEAQAELRKKKPTRVLILRHAEKADDSDWNTDLRSPEGFARAQAWVDLLSAESPVALYTSNLQRTQHTLQPTADALELPLGIRPNIEATPNRPTVADSTALAAEILAEHRGETVVVCWHTPLVSDLAAALGVKEVPEWDHATFDHLWIVTIPRRGPATLLDTTPDFQGSGE